MKFARSCLATDNSVAIYFLNELTSCCSAVLERIRVRF